MEGAGEQLLGPLGKLGLGEVMGQAGHAAEADTGVPAFVVAVQVQDVVQSVGEQMQTDVRIRKPGGGRQYADLQLHVAEGQTGAHAPLLRRDHLVALVLERLLETVGEIVIVVVLSLSTLCLAPWLVLRPFSNRRTRSLVEDVLVLDKTERLETLVQLAVQFGVFVDRARLAAMFDRYTVLVVRQQRRRQHLEAVLEQYNISIYLAIISPISDVPVFHDDTSFLSLMKTAKDLHMM